MICVLRCPAFIFWILRRLNFSVNGFRNRYNFRYLPFGIALDVLSHTGISGFFLGIILRMYQEKCISLSYQIYFMEKLEEEMFSQNRNSLFYRLHLRLFKQFVSDIFKYIYLGITQSQCIYTEIDWAFL